MPTFSTGTISSSHHALTLERPKSPLMGTSVDNAYFPTTSTRQNSTSFLHTGTISNRHYPLTRGRSESPATSLMMSSTGQYNLYSNTDSFRSKDTIRNGQNVLNATTSPQTPNKFSTAITQGNRHYVGKSPTYITSLGETTTQQESTSYSSKPGPSTNIKPGPAAVSRPSWSTAADMSARGCCCTIL